MDISQHEGMWWYEPEPKFKLRLHRKNFFGSGSGLRLHSPVQYVIQIYPSKDFGSPHKHGSGQGRNAGRLGGHNYPWAESLWGRQMAAGGAEKFQQCHKYFLQCSKFACRRAQFRTWGTKLASCPGRHLTSLRLW